MALGVRINYPREVASPISELPFLNYGSRFVIIEEGQQAGLVTIRIRATAYDNFDQYNEEPSLEHPIQYIDISNNSNFSSYLRLQYVENKEYDVENITSYDSEDPNIVISDITDEDASLNIIRIKGWKLSRGPGEKRVYVRFVTDIGVFPPESGQILGYWDSITAVEYAPSVPILLEIDNASDNDYVGEKTILSWMNSNDNIAGVKGYNLNIIKSGTIEIIEDCSSLSHFNPASTIEAETKKTNNVPVLYYSLSPGFAAGEYVINISEETKLHVELYNNSSDYRAWEAVFDNVITVNPEYYPKAASIETSFDCSLPESGSSSIYWALQSFGILYENALCSNTIDLSVIVKKSNLGCSGITSYIDIYSTTGYGAIPTTIEVVPARYEQPIYADINNTHTILNSFNKKWAGYKLIELTNNSCSVTEPTYNSSGELTGYNTERTTFDIEVLENGPVSIKIFYKENPYDIRETVEDDFNFGNKINIRSTDRQWNSNTKTILWQKIRGRRPYYAFNKIKVKVQSLDDEPQLCWFAAVIAPAGANGMPQFTDSTDTNPLTNPLGIDYNSKNCHFFNSCRWDDETTSTIQFDNSKHRIASEVVWIFPGENIISLAPRNFTSSYPAYVTLLADQEYWLGIICYRIDPSSKFTSISDIKISKKNPNIVWKTIDAPIDTTLPERRSSTRSFSTNYPIQWVIEYYNVENPTFPAQFSLAQHTAAIGYFEVYRAQYQTLHGTSYAHLKIILESNNTNITLYDNPYTNPIGHQGAVSYRRHIVHNKKGLWCCIGTKGQDQSDQPVITNYDNIIFADKRIFDKIDLSQNIGYNEKSKDKEEVVEKAYEKTIWTSSDIGTTWFRRYGNLSGVTVGAENNKLIFKADHKIYDDISRYGEIHYIHPTGSQSFELLVNFDLTSGLYNNEFYVVVLPYRYDRCIGEIQQVSSEDVSDFIIIGFRNSGDIYLYRPRPTDGVVEETLVYISPQRTTYNWGQYDVRIKFVNDINVGTTQLNIWHGNNLLYYTNNLPVFSSASPNGFWIALGLRYRRGYSNPVALDINNLVAQYIDPSSSEVQQVVYYEYFDDIPIGYFTYQGIERIHYWGGDGSWYSAGLTNVFDGDSETSPHKISLPYNIYVYRYLDGSLPNNLVTGADGQVHKSVVRLVANPDNVNYVEMTSSNRWFGPYLITGRPLQITDFTRGARWDLFYRTIFGEFAGDSEIFFGISGFLPTNEPGTLSGVTAYQPFPVYNFAETNCTKNTNAQIWAMVNGSKQQIGVEPEQYNSSQYPRFCYVSFASNGEAYLVSGQLTDGNYPTLAPIVRPLGKISLPYIGNLSFIIKPSTGPTTLEPVYVNMTITPDKSVYYAGETITIRWTSSSNAVAVDLNNTSFPGCREIGPTEVNNTTGITTTVQSTTTYKITVVDNIGRSATATKTVSVQTAEPPTVSLTADSSNAPTTIRWATTNAASVVYSNLPGTVTLPSGSMLVSNPGTYTIRVANSSGQIAESSITLGQYATNYPVINSFSVNPTSGQPNSMFTFSWSLSGGTPTSLILTNKTTGQSENVLGRTSISKTISQSSTWELRASNVYGTDTKITEVTIVVPPKIIHPGYTDHGINWQISIDTVNDIEEIQVKWLRTGKIFYLSPLSRSIYLYDNYNSEAGKEDFEIVAKGKNGQSSIIHKSFYVVDSLKYIYYRTVSDPPILITSYGIRISYICQTPHLRNIRVIVYDTVKCKVVYDRSVFYDEIPLDMYKNACYQVIIKDTFSTLIYFVTVPSGQSEYLGIKSVNVIERTVSGVKLYDVYPIVSIDDYNTLKIKGFDVTTTKYTTVNTPHNITIEVYKNNDYAKFELWINSQDTIKQQSFSPVEIYSEQDINNNRVRILSVPSYIDLELKNYTNTIIFCENIPFNLTTPDGIRFICGARTKMPFTKYITQANVSKFALYTIENIITTEDSGFSYWEKKNGILADNNLFYAGRTWFSLQRDDSVDIISKYFSTIPNRTVVAQRFIAQDIYLRCVSVRVNASNYSVAKAAICQLDSNRLPRSRPQATPDPYTGYLSNIISISEAIVVPGMEEVVFTFPYRVLTPSEVLTIGEEYAIVFVDLPSIYGAADIDDAPELGALIWDEETNDWEEIPTNLCIKLASFFWINHNNRLHNEKQQYFLEAVNHCDLVSDGSEMTDPVTVDIVPPYFPGDSSKPPLLTLNNSSIMNIYESGRKVSLLLACSDDNDVPGSGVWDFRVIYEGEFGETIETPYYRFIDEDGDGVITYEMIYDGLFLDVKQFRAEVRDRVGNIARTEPIYIDLRYEFIEDTEPPVEARVRLEGNAFIDPDPNEEEYTNKNIADVSLYVYDTTSGCKDFCVNDNFTESSDGTLIYSLYRPYLPDFAHTLPAEDGLYTIGIKARDYGNNATQDRIAQVLIRDFSTPNSFIIPTVIEEYTYNNNSFLFIGATCKTTELEIDCVNTTFYGNDEFEAYEPRKNNEIIDLKSNQTITVKVNGNIINSTEYTIDYEKDIIIFDRPLSESDVVTIDIVETVARLYRYNGRTFRLIKTFDRENEKCITALGVYEGLLYIGTASGNIYTYNGIKVSNPVYRTLNINGTSGLAVSCFCSARLPTETENNLYVGTLGEGQIFIYKRQGNTTNKTWSRLTTLSNTLYTNNDLYIYDIKLYVDTLFIATGDRGRIYKYTKLDTGTESIQYEQLYQNIFAQDSNFRLNVYSLAVWDGKIFAGTDYDSTVFAYQQITRRQPEDRKWSAKYDLNNRFVASPLPWEIYDNGISASKQSERIEISEVYDELTGRIRDWSMNIKGENNIYTLWIDRCSSQYSMWKNVDNQTGYTVEFSTCIVNPGQNSYNAIEWCDGKYILEARIYPNKISIISGNNIASYNINNSIWHTYRITVKNKNIKLYIDNSNNVAINETDFLEKEKENKYIMFGKTDNRADKCNGLWKYIYFYLDGCLPPVEILESSFARDVTIPFGKEIRKLLISPEGLVALVQPISSTDVLFTDDPYILRPQTYIRKPGNIPEWKQDTTYSANITSIIDAKTWKDKIYSLVEYSTNSANQINKFNMFRNINTYNITTSGMLYCRRLSSAITDSIVIDRTAPNGSLIISEGTTYSPVLVYNFLARSENNDVLNTEAIVMSYADQEIDTASQVLDNSYSTYYPIGTAQAKAIVEDYTNISPNGIKINSIKWCVSSILNKVFTVEYMNTNNQWIVVAKIVSDNIKREYEYQFSNAVEAKYIRINYLGDYETFTSDVVLTVSAWDEGSGTNGIRMSMYNDLRDATEQSGADPETGIIPLGEGKHIIRFNLNKGYEDWAEVVSIDEPIVAGINFNNKIILATKSGKIYTSSDGNSLEYTNVNFNSIVNCFVASDSSIIYAGCENGKLYSSVNAEYWIEENISLTSAISALAIYGDILYIGTSGEQAELYSWNGIKLTREKVFNSTRIDCLYTYNNKLYIILSTTGQVISYDGKKFTAVCDLPCNTSYGIVDNDNILYIAGDKGRVYSYSTNLKKVLDTSISHMKAIHKFIATGPSITSISASSGGNLSRGKWCYAITYIDCNGQESLLGQPYVYEAWLPGEKITLEWKEIENAKGYRIYRNKLPNDINNLYLLKPTYGQTGNYTLLDNEFCDDGSYEITNQKPPTKYDGSIWCGGPDFVYNIDTVNGRINNVILPEELKMCNGILSFNGELYIYGQERAYTQEEIDGILPDLSGGLVKYTGKGFNDIYRPVYYQFIDNIGNRSAIYENGILYRQTIENRIIEIDDDNNIVGSYVSSSEVRSAIKKLYEAGSYTSIPFYAQSVSKYTTIDLLAEIPENTEIKLFIKSASTQSELEDKDWELEFDYEYTSEGIRNISSDIDTLSGSWIQYKIELYTYSKSTTPVVHAITINYVSTNTSYYFYTNVFDLNEIANQEEPGDYNIQIIRCILTWNGSVPTGGAIRFGISTYDEETTDWGYYQIIDSDTIVDLTPGSKFKIGIMLISTDAESAIVDNFGIMFETTERNVKVNI